MSRMVNPAVPENMTVQELVELLKQRDANEQVTCYDRGLLFDNNDYLVVPLPPAKRWRTL